MANRGTVIQTSLLALLGLLLLPFAIYAADFGVRALTGTLAEPHYLLGSVSTQNAAIFSHMILGAVITLLVPLQLVRGIRTRWPALHRLSGRIIVISAIISALGGLFFIATRGTIGGWPMDVGFTLYGLFMLLAAAQTIRHARAGQIAAHNAWALRLFWLILGSWLYRVHYGLWYAATGGLWSNPEFTGAFDLAMNVAFYLPYLIGVEVYLARRRYRVVVN
ncbi:MAG: DUF2306 domain-containing protein [Pseudomonadota bacterium]